MDFVWINQEYIFFDGFYWIIFWWILHEFFILLGSLKINYYGVINQATGEDWQDTQLVLSTATPSIGGAVPELETQNVRIKQKHVV